MAIAACSITTARLQHRSVLRQKQCWSFVVLDFVGAGIRAAALLFCACDRTELGNAAKLIRAASRAARNSPSPPVSEVGWDVMPAFACHWLLHPGEPYDFLATWSVYTMGATGARRACAIEFRPGVKTAVALLPPEVRHLERLLDRTIGSANVALRPWALGSPYNTRAETDAGLWLWAAASPANRRLHADIQAQAPMAQRALARYYAHTFRRARPMRRRRLALRSTWLYASTMCFRVMIRRSIRVTPTLVQTPGGAPKVAKESAAPDHGKGLWRWTGPFPGQEAFESQSAIAVPKLSGCVEQPCPLLAYSVEKLASGQRRMTSNGLF